METSSKDKKVALVVGAQGVIGRNLTDHLQTLEGWGRPTWPCW